MTARDVQKDPRCPGAYGEEFLDREITSACASDMMSDVLAFSKDHSVLITGTLQSTGDPHGGDVGHCLV